MSLNLDLLRLEPGLVLAVVVGLVVIKAAVLYGLGLWHGLELWAARRLGLSLSQGGEFAFVLLSAGVTAGVLTRASADLFSVAVTLSMALTPLLLLADSAVMKRTPPIASFVAPPPEDKHVIIAGFGRMGQIVARILRGKRIPFTALDVNPEQVAFVERFGSKAFFGDASRLEVLEAAQIGKARALVVAIDDVEASLRLVEIVRQRYPDLPVYARARNRNHVHKLMDLGVKAIRRETFQASLELSSELLKGLGYTERERRRTVATFAQHDERRLTEDYRHYTDLQKMQELARSDAQTLERLFDEDAAEQAKVAAAEPQAARAGAAARKELKA